ncbi:uncharacterized protein LOC117555289 [Gymnodraco acuticeps]|uniref:Uncharacterized protein LOC117555289 n=1 Tax=Gymnodraco acuticeps TaxID=8218 RepID=A0A6P8V7W5_GYMAC|nr:uncharacterized protein LOC117555289 [Gymnodraco acuticeps]
MFLQKEMSKKANVDFFCMDVTCRYWPYLHKIAEGLPELLPLTEMRPFLSVMHAKAHTATCEVRGWQKSGRGRKHSGRGSRAGEQLSLQGSSGHKIHDKIRKREPAYSTGHGMEQKEEGTCLLNRPWDGTEGRGNLLTQQAMGWNRRKREPAHSTGHGMEQKEEGTCSLNRPRDGTEGRGNLLTQQAMGWNRRKREPDHSTGHGMEHKEEGTCSLNRPWDGT